MYVDREAMFVELRDDEAVATTENAQWGRIDLDGLDGVRAATTSDALSALHDPAAVLAAVSASQTGMAGPDDADPADGV